MQRGKNRPNRLGVTVARIVRVDGRNVHVAELDAIDGTLVVDLERQPVWATELMANYWKAT